MTRHLTILLLPGLTLLLAGCDLSTHPIEGSHPKSKGSGSGVDQQRVSLVIGGESRNKSASTSKRLKDMNEKSSFEQHHPSRSSKPTLVYVFDTMCGWCYGFGPVIERLEHRYGNRLRIEVISGGLATGDRAAPIGEAYQYIRRALVDVENRTGIRFGDEFRTKILEPGTYHYDSVPPARALALVRQLTPVQAQSKKGDEAKVLAYASAMQHAFFFKGQSLNALKTHRELVGELGLDVKAFTERFESPESFKLAEADFERAAGLGARGYPTLLLRPVSEPDMLITIGRGFIDFRDLEQRLKPYL